MPSLFEDRSRPHQFLTAVLWTLAVAASLVAGGIATLVVVMAFSLDWGETVMAGTEPWIAGLVAVAEFLGIAAASTLGMVLWHTQRFKLAALVLVIGAALLTAVLGTRFIGEYT